MYVCVGKNYMQTKRIIDIKRSWIMINNITFSENIIAKKLYEKIDYLSSELFGKKLLDNCSDFDKKKISVMINEIKYDANRIKNSRFGR